MQKKKNDCIPIKLGDGNSARRSHRSRMYIDLSTLNTFYFAQLCAVSYLHDSGASELLDDHEAVELVLGLVRVGLDAADVLHFSSLNCGHQRVELPLELRSQRLL